MLRASLVFLAVFTVLTGGLYPLLVTGAAQVLFPRQAQGDVALVGQAFSKPENFWSRPSATGPFAYNAAASSGSNLGPSNPALAQAVGERIAALRAADATATGSVPADLVTASASGLDPHLSPDAARFQVHRVAQARGLSDAQVLALVDAHVEGRTLGVLGEPRVNVVALNRALAEAKP
jgi:K+-transporting ATPase ATPase C chain